MALSTNFTQCTPVTTKFGKITLNKGHFAVQGHSRSHILVPIKSSYTASYIKTIAKQVLRTVSHSITEAVVGMRAGTIFYRHVN